MAPSMLDPEMIEDRPKIVNEAVQDKFQVNLIINNRAGGHENNGAGERGIQDAGGERDIYKKDLPAFIAGLDNTLFQWLNLYAFHWAILRSRQSSPAAGCRPWVGSLSILVLWETFRSSSA
jgi:hypothetical protein